MKGGDLKSQSPLIGSFLLRADKPLVLVRTEKSQSPLIGSFLLRQLIRFIDADAIEVSIPSDRVIPSEINRSSAITLKYMVSIPSDRVIPSEDEGTVCIGCVELSQSPLIGSFLLSIDELDPVEYDQ